MNRPLPALATILGVLGLIPFAAAGLGALSGDLVYGPQSLFALIAYGAVILAFLGGVHWGFGLEAETGVPVKIQRARFGLGVMPSLLGWLAILLAFIPMPFTGAALPLVALPLLVVGYIALTVTEGRASRQGFVPRGYMGLRWFLSAVVVVILVTVWTVLLLGGRLVLW